VRALAHITGGGIAGNLVRVLPAGAEAVVDAGGWPWPTVFRVLMRAGDVSLGEMRRVFNLGIGMIAVAGRDDAEAAIAAATRAGVEARIVSGKALAQARTLSDLDVDEFFAQIEDYKAEFAFNLSHGLEDPNCGLTIPPYISSAFGFLE